MSSNSDQRSGGDVVVTPKRQEVRRSSAVARMKNSRDHVKKTNKERHNRNENHDKAKRAFKSHRNVFKDGGNEVDPLNIKKIISHDVPGSPRCNSPLVECNEKSNLADVQPADITDPLKLKSLDDGEVIVKTPKKKKKRKRRHTFQGELESVEVKHVSLEELEDDAVADDSSQTVEEDAPPPISSRMKRKRFHSDSKSEDDKTIPLKTKPRLIASVKAEETKVVTAEPNRSPVSEPTTTPVEPSKTEKQLPGDSTACKSRNYRVKDRRFIYGNYNRYYGYRNPNCSDDDRIHCLKQNWFEGKSCLDIGCNVGHLTLWLARHYKPSAMNGVDIDEDLIKAANSNVRHYLSKPLAVEESQFPISLAICHGPLAAPVISTKEGSKASFPYNVSFHTANYAPLDKKSLDATAASVYDTILCLSITKWIHLNWGDKGLKMTFQKIYKQLRPGGRLILEPQPFKSYKKKKNLTPEIRTNFDAIKFKPDSFIKYLLSNEVGFASSEILSLPQNKAKGFQRPLYLLTKSAASMKETTSDQPA